jgi:hypothetical protein
MDTRREICNSSSPEHTEFRFEVTGKKIGWLKPCNVSNNFAFCDFDKALDLFNSQKEATIWMVKVRNYELCKYARSCGRRSYDYYVDEPRKMMMRKGSKYRTSRY